jgi:hypothetical protein
LPDRHLTLFFFRHDAPGHPRVGGQDSGRPSLRADRHDCPGQDRSTRALSRTRKPQEKTTGVYVGARGYRMRVGLPAHQTSGA